MTPEDTSRIVDAIDRNTEAVERQTEWLKLEEVDPSLEVLQDIRNWLKAIWLVIVVMAVIWMFITPAKATPLLPPLAQPVIIEIGTPPLPPPNPHLQYWHTSYVPGPDGVLPVEVFAPRLVAQMASDAAVVDVPEPGTWWLVALGAPMLFGYAMAELSHRRMLRKMKAAQRRNELVAEFVDKQLWQFISLDDWLTKHPEIARKALEEKP